MPVPGGQVSLRIQAVSQAADGDQVDRVVRVDVVRSLALCEDQDGARESVEIALVEPVSTGDSVLVHAGTALQVLG